MLQAKLIIIYPDSSLQSYGLQGKVIHTDGRELNVFHFVVGVDGYNHFKNNLGPDDILLQCSLGQTHHEKLSELGWTETTCQSWSEGES